MIYENSILYLSDLTDLTDLSDLVVVRNQPGPPGLSSTLSSKKNDGCSPWKCLPAVSGFPGTVRHRGYNGFGTGNCSPHVENRHFFWMIK